MTTGILLVTHAPLGAAFLEVVRHVYQSLPAQLESIDVAADAPVVQIESLVAAACGRLNSGNGVLIFSDILGATPCNCASRAAQAGSAMIAGVSLPLLLKALQYRQQSASELAQTLQNAASQTVQRL